MLPIIVGTILVLLIIVFIWFIIPYSPVEYEFLKKHKELLRQEKVSNEIFKISQLKHLPQPIQNFFIYSGLIDKKIMTASTTIHTDVDFILAEGKPSIKIKYIQNNYSNEPKRLAFIDTKIYGIPFQGIDSYINGEGCMKGVLAKGLTLFEQKSKEMNQAALVTVLAESIVCPSAFLLECITWETIDNNHVRATITHKGIKASGIYTFSKEGAILSFKTNDRYEVDKNGNSKSTPWTAECGDYVDVDGIKYPTTFKGIWNRDNEDLLYFNCNNVRVEYKY